MTLQTTPLDPLHRELGAKMVAFAGYSMPVQYRNGIISEHLQTRNRAGLFDVSHMGQVVVKGPGTAAMLESLVPADVENLSIDAQTYTLFTNDQGGVLDDLIITRWAENCFFLVVNAACKTDDIAHLRGQLAAGQRLAVLADRALLALQGPAAREVIQTLSPDAARLGFMRGCRLATADFEGYITCSGYTGEDGFELSVPASQAEALARQLLGDPRVEPIGLGARDTLRLEAGLCLYGHELSATIDPIQAGLSWAISKARRADGARAGGFPGAEMIFNQLAQRPAQQRVGLTVEGKRPVRDGQIVMSQAGTRVGEISSAGYGASAGGPIAMAYLERSFAAIGTRLGVDVRGNLVPVTVTKMPFIPHRYHRN